MAAMPPAPAHLAPTFPLYFTATTRVWTLEDPWLTLKQTLSRIQNEHRYYLYSFAQDGSQIQHTASSLQDFQLCSLVLNILHTATYSLTLCCTQTFPMLSITRTEVLKLAALV